MGCDAGAIFAIIVLIIIAVLFLLIALYALHKFINEINEKRSKLNKAFEIIFLLCTITVVILIVILAFHPCNVYSEGPYVRLHLYCGGFFLVQAFMTLILFYNKLLRIFDGTVIGLNKWTKRIYNSVFFILGAVQVIWLILTSISFIIGNDIPGLIFLIILSLLITLLMNISMVVLFTSKLVKTIQNVTRRIELSATGSNSSASSVENDTEDDRLVAAISKLTLLTTISLISTIADYVWQNIADSYVEKGIATDGMWIAVTYVWMIDLFTNFLCIILCYQAFKGNYLKLCRCMDTCCRNTVSKACVRTAKATNKKKPNDSMNRARSASNGDD